jgi:hypothetical protein
MRNERELRLAGFRRVAGIDEVGRGSLAGPVVAAAVVLPERHRIRGIRDSKVLTHARREVLYELILDRAEAVGVGCVEVEVIDRINILQATKLAMGDALRRLSAPPDHLLIDALSLRDVERRIELAETQLDLDLPVREQPQGIPEALEELAHARVALAGDDSREPAVPQLAVEIARTERGLVHVAVGIALRNIGDRRAVPALIHALPKVTIRADDCGVSTKDPTLHLFMVRQQDVRHRYNVPLHEPFVVGRPVREITLALEALTGHTEGRAILSHFDNEGRWPTNYWPEDRQRPLYLEVADRWAAWLAVSPSRPFPV